MTDRIERLEQSVRRGAEAAALLENPLLAGIFSEYAEVTTKALLELPVGADQERLALCTVLKVLRAMPQALQHAAQNGEFDAKRLLLVMNREGVGNA